MRNVFSSKLKKAAINLLCSYTGRSLGSTMLTSVILPDHGLPRSQQECIRRSSAHDKFRPATRSTAMTLKNVVRQFHCDNSRSEVLIIITHEIIHTYGRIREK
jgi:hypothetical protein